jgi:SAM-dependent methyltransferase
VLVPLFATTLFLTSGLLFAVEPLIAKGLLPSLGGGAAVWTTAVAFFQLALVVGYLYAHLAARLGTRKNVWLHVALLAAVAVLFPLRAPDGWAPPPSHQALWLFVRLATTIGPPFILLAATAPLVQSWLAASGHRDARDPYFLYAASNAGSMLALLAYPIAIEPFVGLGRQRRLWGAGLAVAVALLLACAASVLRVARRAGEPNLQRQPSGPTSGLASQTVRWSERWRWLALAAVPSSLLLSVTSYVTTDLVALPLLWVLPLALYLLTFIVAFGNWRLFPARRMVWLQPMLLVPLTAEMFLTTEGSALVLIPVHAAVFFVTALVCHQTLARSRPPADRSTEFYLWIAFGGALGGLFNVFLAPLLFRSLVEYPLGLVAAALLRPRAADAVDASPSAGDDLARARRRDVGAPLLLLAALAGGVWLLRRLAVRMDDRTETVILAFVLAAAGAAAYSFRGRPLRFGLGLAAVIISGAFYAQGETHLVFAARSFYAVHKVTRDGPTTFKLASGNTLHGEQNLSPTMRREPLTYYHRTSPIGDVMKAWAGSPARRQVGLIGLGAGTLAAYSEPGERWTYFEIDPVVVEVARDRFSYLGDARGEVNVVLGDGRLSLAAEPDRTFGLLVLDAFSSDAVPVHLLTREALALYLRKLAPGGVLAFHLSNRHLALTDIVAGGATAEGLVGLTRSGGVTPAEASQGKSASTWVVLARSASDLGPLAPVAGWSPLPRGGRAWTDDASSLWSVLDLRER